MIDSTGPKISSWAIVMSGVTSEKTVGLHEVAVLEALGRLGAAGHELRALLDALADVAAHALALRLGDQRARACVPGSSGSPTREPAASVAAAIASASASRSRGTSMRVSALQVWPELRKHLPTPVGDGASSGRRRRGSRSATCRPARAPRA